MKKDQGKTNDIEATSKVGQPTLSQMPMEEWEQQQLDSQLSDPGGMPEAPAEEADQNLPPQMDQHFYDGLKAQWEQKQLEASGHLKKGYYSHPISQAVFMLGKAAAAMCKTAERDSLPARLVGQVLVQTFGPKSIHDYMTLIQQWVAGWDEMPYLDPEEVNVGMDTPMAYSDIAQGGQWAHQYQAPNSPPNMNGPSF